MTPPPDTIDQAYEVMKAGFIETLVANAADAFVDGEVRASQLLRIPLNFNLINSRAVSLTRDYRETLERFGGSDVTVIGEDGIARRVFKPWLNDMVQRDKESVGQIIQDSIQNGSSLRDVEKALDGVFAAGEHDARLTAFQETKALYNKGTMQRFAHENVQQGIWHHSDPQEDPREEHQALEGKAFDLDDPQWDELNLPNCKCWCEPVIIGATEIGNIERDSAVDRLMSAGRIDTTARG